MINVRHPKSVEGETESSILSLSNECSFYDFFFFFFTVLEENHAGCFLISEDLFQSPDRG